MKSSTITTELITDLAEFAALEEHWNALLQNSSQETVFLSWQWLHTWWQVFAEERMQLHIVLFRCDDKLVGVAPLYLQPGHIVSGTILRFIGTGEAEEDQVVSEYLDIFAASAHEEAVVTAMALWLSAHKAWRRIQFDDVLGSSLALRVASRVAEKNRPGQGYSLDRHVSGQRYFISLPATMDEYLERLSASRRKRFARCAKALKKDGGDTAGQRLRTLSELPDYLPVLQQLNTERWRDRGGKGVFESQRFAQFHQQLSAQLVPKGQAGVTLVKQAESPVAALYLFFSRSVCHYYQSGFRAEGANRYMPLFLGHMAEIQHSIECKLGTYDFMRGAAESYKQDYGCESAPMYTLRAWSSNIERLLFVTHRSARAKIAKRLRATGLLGKRP